MQTHDYNPGYLGGWPDGVFWTMAVAPETVSVDPTTGVASYRMENLAIPDYTNIPNALANGPTLPGKVSFDVRWAPNAESKRWLYHHEAEPSEPDSYAVDYWNTQATLEWQAETEATGFRFASYKIGEYPEGRAPGQLFAIAGRERNGVDYKPFSAAPEPAPSATTSAPPEQDTLPATGGTSLGPLGVASLGAAALLAFRSRARRPSSEGGISRE